MCKDKKIHGEANTAQSRYFVSFTYYLVDHGNRPGGLFDPEARKRGCKIKMESDFSLGTGRSVREGIKRAEFSDSVLYLLRTMSGECVDTT